MDEQHHNKAHSQSDSGKANKETFLPPLRCSFEYKKQIENRAKKAGMKPSEYRRQALLKSKIVVRATQSLEPVDPIIIKQLLHIGNNLNQLVTKLHSTGQMTAGWEQTHQELSDFLHEKIFVK